ncbi:MAG: glycosyltransferase [Xanthobacteraceae bacterium]
MSQAANQSTADQRGEVHPPACVDVLIAARDRADTIERAILSALAEDDVRMVIVTDDGSTDDTAARALQCDLAGGRVVVERLRTSIGPAAARNRALEISTAPWIAILDADDYFLPGRVGRLLSRSNDCDLVADSVMHVAEGEVGPEPARSVNTVDSSSPLQLTLEEFVLGNVTRPGSHRKELGYVKPLIRRCFLDSRSLRYDESLRFGEDYILYARALAAGARFLLIPTPGYVAVERSESLSARHTRHDLEALGVSASALMATSELSPRDRAALVKHLADIDRRTQWLVIVEALQSLNYRQFLAPFLRSPALALYLTGRLVSEVPRQIKKRLKRLSQQ